MTTTHKIVNNAAQELRQIENNSIDLVVTSPPYPMIEMWDEIMAKQNPLIGEALKTNNGQLAFEMMHLELDKVWAEVSRVLTPGGFACINIGDATRTIDGDFQLYPNHSRIISAFQKLGIPNLPNILWRKQTNAPNKFMGSGMLPAGAYVTLEHEWILIFRKGGKRIFKTESEKLQRRSSSFFWEERNVWFSDIWDLKGTKQKIDNSSTRTRSAAYPFEIPYRLINMYSMQGDTVLDPFLGIGTTLLASITSQRNSIGYEIDHMLLDVIKENIANTPVAILNTYIQNRIEQHKQFVIERNDHPESSELKHFNKNLQMAVMTSQETEIKLSFVEKIETEGNEIHCSYNHIKPDESETPLKGKNKSEKTLFDL